MKYCSKCGAELFDDAVVCPKCGLETEVYQQQKEKKLAEDADKKAKTYGILAIVFGILGGFLGALFGIWCIKEDKNHKYRFLGIIGIILFLVWTGVSAVLNS